MSAERIASFTSSFGPLLRRYRAAVGLTQEALAARAGLSVRAISDLERGVKHLPRRETVSLLAEALALPPRKRALLAAAARPMTEPTRALDALVSRPPHNLPAQLTPLIGREREARLAADVLGRADVRLLTLTGPGGVGKTRLALQVAEDALDGYEDGVYVALLAALDDPSLVCRAVAETIGLRLASEEPPDEQVRAFLRDKQLLLVLDNFEHVLAAAPPLGALLSACPHVKALVTSREPLRIAGEHELAVAPLRVEAARELFATRARAAAPALTLADDDWAAVDAICQRVDRLPLAIELAAVWVKVLPLPALLQRLDHRLELLTSGRRDAPPRQRTLRDTIAWSENLLAPGDQALFQRLGVFAGSYTPEAVATICGDEGAAVLDGLASLVEQSLLEVESPHNTATGPRFWMLETIREYALERLRSSGEAEMLARRHAAYYTRLAVESAWLGPGQDARDQHIERDMPNLRAALEWARERGEADLGLRLATALGRFWYTRGALDEGERWLGAMLALDGKRGAPPTPARLRGQAQYFLVLYALDRRDYDRAEALAREGLALARAHDDLGGAGNMLAELGHVAEARGDLAGARTFFEESLAACRAGSDHGALGRTLSSLGNLARAMGDYDRARSYLEESVAWARARDFSWAVASGLAGLGHIACEEGDFSHAAGYYREALGLFRGMRNPTTLAWCLEGVVVVVEATGAHERAAQLSGAIAGLRESVRADVTTADWPPFTQASAAAHQALGEPTYTMAERAGAALTPERAVTLALAVLPRARRTHDAR